MVCLPAAFGQQNPGCSLFSPKETQTYPYGQSAVTWHCTSFAAALPSGQPTKTVAGSNGIESVTTAVASAQVQVRIWSVVSLLSGLPVNAVNGGLSVMISGPPQHLAKFSLTCTHSWPSSRQIKSSQVRAKVAWKKSPLWAPAACLPSGHLNEYACVTWSESSVLL